MEESIVEDDDDDDEMMILNRRESSGSRNENQPPPNHYHDDLDEGNQLDRINNRLTDDDDDDDDEDDLLNVMEMTEEKEPPEPVYQIRPRLDEKFKPMTVKEVIHNVLFDQLSTKTYNSEDANEWSKGIADTIKNKVKDLKFKRYKYIVNVVLGEQKGAGLKMGTRCIWDAEADSYAYDNFVNDTIFCVASVYAVYFY